VFFEDPGVAENRTQEDLLLENQEGFEDRVWAEETVETSTTSSEGDGGLWGSDHRFAAHELYLCAGDEGYVQRNRDTPMNTGIGDETGEENLYGMIVITDTERDECGDVGGYEPYEGSHSAEQLYIYDGGFDWPETQYFDLRGEGDDPGRGGREWVDLEGDADACEIYWREDRTRPDGATLRTYSVGTEVGKDQSTFRHSAGFEAEDSEHRASGMRAFNLIDAMSDDADRDGTGLDGRDIDNPDGAGEIRPQSSNLGKNELYGDLLCANPDGRDYAEWHLCGEGLSESRQEMDIDGESWICDVESGDWTSDADIDGGEYRGSYSGEQLYIYDDGWPELNNFELRGGSESEKSFKDSVGLWETDLRAGSNRCHVFYREDSTSRDGATTKTYSTGSTVDRLHSGFRSQEGFVFENDDSRTGANAHGLMDDMDLDGSESGDSVNFEDLRVQEDFESLNELHGDLLCAHPEYSVFENAEWLLCSEGQTVTEVSHGSETWSCDTESGEWSSDARGPGFAESEIVTTDWDDAEPESMEWLETEEDSFNIDSSETNENIYILWGSELLNGWDRISIEVEPEEYGHLQMGGVSTEFNSRTYFYFDENGEDNIWVQRQNDGEWNYDEVADYETGSVYTFEFDGVSGVLSIEEDSEEIWSENVDITSLDFPIFRVYQGSGGNSWENTNVNVTEVEFRR